ncbi:MAG: leucyl aminopeptidase family protein [Gammaproteobacteria bacterium]|nr:leucyl aminopeptidase family protein [Gammaproteobacteria bacterium]
MSFSNNKEGIPLYPVNPANYEQWLGNLPGVQQKWLKAAGFQVKAGELCSLPDSNGEMHGYAFGMANEGWLYQLASLPAKLPAGTYELVSDWSKDQRLQASLGWGLACYRFELYRKSSKDLPSLIVDDDIAVEAENLLSAQSLVRDLVNTTTEDLGPAQLADAMQIQADEFKADMAVIHGVDLLTKNFPAIHAVGRASDREPRLLKMEWGDEDDPLLALCGKGVCFDSGGLNLKPGAGMALMKKDMGGAAHVLGLARLIMQARLPVRLLVLIPAVENSVSGNAYRPGDVISTRKGLKIEIGNTDAEGRVVLADALAYACESEPDLVIDFATLTGAARIALGTDLPPVFSNDIVIANEITAMGDTEEDPLWVMPLYQPYKDLLKSPIADLNNMSKTPYGGCITAALFLEYFVTPETDWVHIDTWAWNQGNRPGRPEGGEAIGLRAVFRYLEKRYS